MQSKRYSIATMVLGLLIFNIACEEKLAGPDDDVTSMRLLEGTWELTGLTATYVRDIALPADSAAGDSFSVDAYWDLASIVLGESAALADLHLFAFFEGDTLLDSTVALPTPAHLAALGLEMEVVFKDDGTYTLGGTYPTIRLDEAACRSALSIAPIEDTGNFDMDYLNGILGVSPSVGEQVLPPFDDAEITFSSDSSVMQFNFIDRDAHDTKFPDAGFPWDETKLRVTMGVADLPVNALGSFDTSGPTTNDTAYIMDAALASWSGFLTFYAMAIKIEIEYRLTPGSPGLIETDYTLDGVIDADDVVAYLGLVDPNGSTFQLGLPYSLLVAVVEGVPGLVNDSDHDFDATNATAGGKLKYVIKAVCIPVNEIITFESTWSRVTTQ
ncbi:MAG: hypothetical protein IID14_05635 [Candidatus Marinimicrobia bacterium]|nr:hypothetical protein [Candidatus Neomarinimicrobiota bacterium]